MAAPRLGFGVGDLASLTLGDLASLTQHYSKNNFSKGLAETGIDCSYLNGTIPRTSAGDESSSALITGVYADPRAGFCVASLLDTALHIVRVVGAVVGQVETLGCATGCFLAGSFPILPRY